MTKDASVGLTITLTGTYTPGTHTFTIKLAGVSHDNEDGTSRQALLRKSRPGDGIELRREPDNPYDRWAIAVHKLSGGQLGYIPEGDRRLAEHIDRGGRFSARIAQINGGPSFIDRILGRKGRSYGCVIEIEKGDFDWRHVASFIELDRAAAELCRNAKQQEKNNPDLALELYKQACIKICELHSCGRQAQAWRTTRHPVNRMSLLLERKKDHGGALRVIDDYLAANDPLGLSNSDAEAVSKRQERLKQHASS